MIIASVAAETVPEYSAHIPRLPPKLIPDTTSFGGSSSKTVIASLTQSAGVPLTA